MATTGPLKPAAVSGGQGAQGPGGVVDGDDRKRGRRADGQCAAALDEEAGGACRQGALDEEMAVVGGTLDGDEELGGCDGAGVDRYTIEARGLLALEQLPAGPVDDIAGQEGNAHGLRLPSARSASTRSSKGSFSRPMIW